jgi:capsular exopolysaccharide synthesis family protein
MVQSSDPGRPADRVPPDSLSTRRWDLGSVPSLPTDPLNLYGGARPAPAIKPFQLSAVLRYRRTILLGLLVVAIPAILAIWLFTVPQYRATAQVHVRPIIPRLVFDREGGPIPLYQSYFNTQVAIIRSPTVLQRALDQKDVQETRWYLEPPQPVIGSPLSPMERLSKDLRVDPRGMTEVIDIAMSSPVAKDAAVIVNAVLDQYIRTVRESSSRMEDTLYNELLDRFNSYRTDIEGRQTTVDRLRKDLGTANPDELVGQQRMRIDALEAALGDLDRDTAVAERQRRDLAALIGNEATSTAPSNDPGEAAGRYDNDVDWLRLYIESRKAQLELEVQQSRLGDAHPTITRLQKQAELVETLLRERELQLDEQRQLPPGTMATDLGSHSLRPGPRQILDNLNNQIRMMQYKRELLTTQLTNEQKRFSEIFDSARTLAKENEQIQFQRQIFEAVRTRLTEKEMERNVPGSIESLARAYAASEPYHDRRVLYSVLAVLVGLGAGFAAALLRVTFTEQIHEARDLPPAVGPPLLGHLPLLPRLEGGGKIDESPILGESVRMVRTALLERLQGGRGQSVLVTSSASAEGKTTFAWLLARSLAQCGSNVLLVDTDLRKAAARRAGGEAGRGLAAALSGEVPEAEVIGQTDVPRLSVVPTGDVARTDLETLADGRFAGLLEKWSQRFDVVLLDSPPVLPVADARILARQVDGTILIIREGTSRRPDVLEALACLRTAGAEVIGTVFIGSTGRESYESGYYSYNGRRAPQPLTAGGAKAT